MNAGPSPDSAIPTDPFQRLLSHAPVVLWTTDRDLRITNIAGGGLRALELETPEFVGRLLEEVLDEPQLSAVRDAHRRALAGEETGYDVEFAGRVYQAHLEPLSDDGERIGGVAGIVYDVTEHRRAQRLQSALFRISEVAATADDLDELYAALHRIVGELMYAENFYIALYDEGEDLLSFPYFADAVDESPGEVPAEGTLTHYVIRTGEPLMGDEPALRRLEAAGEFDLRGTASIDWLGVPLTAEKRTFGALVVQSYDETVHFSDEHRELLTFVSRHIAHVVSQRRSAERLRESKARFRRLVESAPVAIGVHDGERILFANPACVELLEAGSVEELVGTPIMELVHPDDRDAVAERIEKAREEGTPAPRREERLVTLKGRVLDAEVIGIPTRFDGESAVQVVVHDLTPLHEAEAERERSLRLLEATLESSADGILAFDHEFRYTIWNPAMERISGRTAEEVVGRRAFDVFPFLEEIGEERHFRAALDGRSTVARDRPFRVPETGEEGIYEGHYAPLRAADGDIVGGLAVIRDVTEQRQLEEQLHRAQRMEAVGRLAGGVAHDFNNLLTAILGYGELLLDSLAPSTSERGHVREILRAGKRAEDLTRQLLAFGRRQVLQPRTIDLNDAVRDVERMLDHLLGEDIEVRLDLEPTLAPVTADPGQIEQVIVNLAVNARDAMRGGGTLTIATDNTVLGEELAPGEGDVEIEPGSYALLRVSDTGVGMDEETLEQVFDPFFTTKQKGEGTGLGLATVYGIVRQSGGSIRVSSEPERGSTFEVYLPETADVESTAATRPRPAASGPVREDAETVLVVEDEPAVRRLARDVLESDGYEVLEADDGEAALEVSRQLGDDLDLLVTDMVMPQLGGRELAERLLAANPRLRVLYVSGYTEDRVASETDADAGHGFLDKPFTRSDLLTKVRSLLDEE